MALTTSMAFNQSRDTQSSGSVGEGEGEEGKKARL